MKIWLTSISGKPFEFHEKERARLVRMLRHVLCRGAASSRNAHDELYAYDLIATSSPRPDHPDAGCRRYNHQGLTEHGSQLLADLSAPGKLVDVKAVLDAKFSEYAA
jgi:hypothetical protein